MLGATSQVLSQLADDVRRFGQQSGISTLILDWTGSGIPPLAVALAMAETRAAEFLDNHLSEKGLAAKAVDALKAIRESEGFAEHAARIRSELQEPTIGIAVARRAKRRTAACAGRSRPCPQRASSGANSVRRPSQRAPDALRPDLYTGAAS